MSPDIRRRSSDLLAWTMLIVAIGMPVVWIVGYSLAYSFGLVGLLSEGATLKHWQAAFTVGGLRESLVFSLAMACAVTFLSTVGALGVTLVAPTIRHSRFLMVLLCLPLATPGAVLAVMAYQWLNPGGFLARLAYQGGVIDSPSDFPPLVNDRFAVGMLLAQVSSAWPLLTLFLLNAWSSARIDRYCRLAETLGASRFQARWRIALPMLLQRVRPLMVLILLWNLGSYEIPLLLGRQSPQMFSVLTQRRFGQFQLHDRPQAFVLASCYLFLVGIGLILLLSGRRPRG